MKPFPLILGRVNIIHQICFGKIIDIGCGLGTTFGKDAVNLDIYPNEKLIAYAKNTDQMYYDKFMMVFPEGKTANYVQADATKNIP